MLAKSYFVKPYKDELFHSLIARFMMYTLLSLKEVKRDIFGSEHIVCPLNYPTSVNMLVERGLFSTEECHKLLEENTLLPYLLFACEAKKRDEVYSSIWGFSPFSWSIVNILGLNAEGSKYSNRPKYCPKCNNENLEKYGEIFWNRNHQIPGIGICVEHDCFLEDIIQDNSTYTKYPLYMPMVKYCPIKEARINSSESIRLVARNCISILGDQHHVDLDYLNRAKNLGYAKYGKIDHKSIERDFNSFYQDNHFLNIRYSKKQLALEKKSTPYRIIMMDCFLKSKSQTNYQSPRERVEFWDQHFFGDGPWNCANPKCKWYSKPGIKNAKFFYDNKKQRTIGYFLCNCRMNYNKSFAIESGSIVKVLIKAKIRKRFKVRDNNTAIAKLNIVIAVLLSLTLNLFRIFALIRTLTILPDSKEI